MKVKVKNVKKFIEPSLNESEIRYRRLFETAQDGILILDAQTGAITDVNPFLIDMLGYSRDEFMDKKLWEVGAFKDIKASREAFEVLQKDKYIRYQDLPLKAKDGHLIQVEFVSNVYLVDSKKVIQCNIRDITERKQAEDEIKSLAKFPDENPFPILRLNDKGVILRANRASRAMLEDWKTTIGQPAPEFWRKNVTESLENQSQQIIEVSIGPRILSFVVVPITGEGYVNLYGHDITERLHAEKEAQFLASMVESADEAIIGKTLEGIILSWNRGTEKLYGYSAQEAVGKPISLIAPPGKFNEIQEILEKVGRGEPIEHFETVRLGRDGKQIDVSLNVSPVRDANEKIIAASTIARNITDRKQAEKTLKDKVEELRRMATVVSDSNDAVIMHDLDGKILAWNRGAQDTYGYTESEALGKNVREIVAGPDREAALTLVEKIKQGEIVKSFELRRLAKDGRVLDVWLTTTLLTDESGKPVAIATTERDITERKRAEEEISELNAGLERRVVERTTQLEAANKELESFSYSVSHDLRAPLRSIDGFSQVLLEDYTDKLDAAGQDALKRVCAAAQRMAQLIDDILKLSRVTRSEMRLETVSLSAMAHAVLDELQRTQPERQVDCVIAEGIVVKGDTQLLRAVLENLLGNAWKFTGKQGYARIEFGMSQRGGERAFFVHDNGAGFDMAFVNKLFGAFQRLHPVEEFPGTGIGLATVQRIIHRHGGRVWAEGALAQGATFYFTLPEETI